MAAQGIDSGLLCPSCQAPLAPRVLGCNGCGITVEGPFALNEFAALSAEDLHFLRVFVQSEGRVREMQSALGLSYPTVRARILALKNRLVDAPLEAVGTAGRAPRSTREHDDEVEATLKHLAAGEIDFKRAMDEIRLLRKHRAKPGDNK